MMRGRSGPPSFSGYHLPPLPGGIIALVVPVLCMVPTIQALLGDGGTVLDDPTSPVVSGVLFLAAAPTVLLIAPFDLAPALTVSLAAVTSLPVWFAIGARLAIGARTWGRWWARYLTVAATWTIGFLLLVAAIATIVG